MVGSRAAQRRCWPGSYRNSPADRAVRHSASACPVAVWPVLRAAPGPAAPTRRAHQRPPQVPVVQRCAAVGKVPVDGDQHAAEVAADSEHVALKRLPHGLVQRVFIPAATAAAKAGHRRPRWHACRAPGGQRREARAARDRWYLAFKQLWLRGRDRRRGDAGQHTAALKHQPRRGAAVQRAHRAAPLQRAHRAAPLQPPSLPPPPTRSASGARSCPGHAMLLLVPGRSLGASRSRPGGG
jgi:hypothetical protein